LEQHHQQQLSLAQSLAQSKTWKEECYGENLTRDCAGRYIGFDIAAQPAYQYSSCQRNWLSWPAIPGSTWSTQNSNSLNALSGISNNLTVIGVDNNKTLVENWDGNTWSIVPKPNQNEPTQMP